MMEDSVWELNKTERENEREKCTGICPWFEFKVKEIICNVNCNVELIHERLQLSRIMFVWLLKLLYNILHHLHILNDITPKDV